MPQRSQDLEQYRDRFLDQLQTSKPMLDGHDVFLHYWRTVEQEASQTEELGKLENWVRDLARDKEKVGAVKQRLETSREQDAATQALLHLLHRILSVLDGMEQKLRRRRDDRRRVLGWLLLVAGPGVKKKVPEEKPADGKKEGEEEKVSEAVLAKPKAPDPKKPPEGEKKLAR